jgi:predicted regulator of Ras-like GTPase activity (Roadblock/LC7/MglB family)
MEEIEDMLKKLRTHGAFGSAIIARDGTLLASDVTDSANIETFTIMMATMFGAAVTAANELNKKPPTKVVAESEDFKMLLTTKGKKMFLAVILPKDANENEILKKTDKILKSAEELES